MRAMGMMEEAMAALMAVQFMVTMWALCWIFG